MNIDDKYLRLLQNNILEQHKFQFVIKLDASSNSKITNVSSMKNLKELDAGGDSCGINQEGIEGLDLVKLDAWNNSKITSLIP